MANDTRDLRVVVYLGKDSLADFAVTLHETTLVKCQSTGFFKQAWWKANLANVVDESTEMHELLLRFGQLHPHRDVTGIRGYGCGVTRRIPVSCVECRDKRGSEREV